MSQETQLPSNIPPQSEVKPVPQSPGAEVQGIPAVLVWALGGMAVLMCLVAVGLGLYCYWADLHLAVKVVSLLLVPALLWGGYYAAAKHGMRSAEVAAVFACLSWLVLLVLVQCCLYSLALWQMGLIFVGGLLILPLVHPWRSAVVALATGCVVELVLLWWCLGGMQIGMGRVWVWVSLLATLVLWAIGGGWCLQTHRAGYAPFGRIAPAAFTAFLCVFYLLIMFPQYLLGEELSLSGAEWAAFAGLWLLPLVAALPLHIHFARRRSRAVFSYALLAFGGLSLVSVPLLLLVNMPFLTAPLAFVYALSIVYYGAEYKSPWLVLAGCVAFFLSSLSIPLRLGVNPMGSAIILLLLGSACLVVAFRLAARRRRLLALMQLARAKQEHKAAAPTPQTSTEQAPN